MSHFLFCIFKRFLNLSLHYWLNFLQLYIGFLYIDNTILYFFILFQISLMLLPIFLGSFLKVEKYCVLFKPLFYFWFSYPISTKQCNFAFYWKFYFFLKIYVDLIRIHMLLIFRIYSIIFNPSKTSDRDIQSWKQVVKKIHTI